MDPTGSIEYASNSTDVAEGILEANDEHITKAREMLFDEILKQLALCDFFSNIALGLPSIFPVYAHGNDAVGAAHADCVRDLIRWLTEIKAGVLSDRSALPPLISREEDISAQQNILANQIRLLPVRTEGKYETDKAFKSLDKVIVCESEVLQRYCETPFARYYIESIVKMWNKLAGHPMEKVKSEIQQFVNGLAKNDEFHHVLTEVAFLQIRRLHLFEHHGMTPVSLGDGYKWPEYLSTFSSTDLILKLKSPTPAGKHKLFLDLIEQLFVEQKDLIQAFKRLYDETIKELKLDGVGVVSKSNFRDCLHRKVTRLYHEYWSIFATAMRNGRYVVYAGKVGQCLFDITKKGKEDERWKILNWVSPMAAAPMHGKYHDGSTQRLEGTCDWIIQDKEFRDWHESELSAILSLCGSMGMGKTYATSRVTDWVKYSLQDSNYDEALAYFYCIKNDENRNNAKAVLRSILRQIATGPWTKRDQEVALDEAIIDIWNKHKKDQFYETFDEWKNCLFKLLSKYPRVTIVLDALDECDPTDREQLVDLFTAIVDVPYNTKIFVSTRPESDLLQWLGKSPSINMHKGHTARDITAFVQKRIARHGAWRYLKREHQEKITRILVDKSLNMFLFAKLQIDSLNIYKTGGDIERALEQLPTKLTEAYDLIYDQATKGLGAKRWVDRALRWVMCSMEPLTSEELLLAISQGPEATRIEDISEDLSEELLSNLCNNLLSLDSSGKRSKRFADRLEDPPAPVWRFAHQAVAEYFRTRQECASMHFEVGRVCLLILLDTFGGSAVEDKSDSRHIGVRNNYQCPCRQEIHSEEPTWQNRRHFEMQEALAVYATHAWPTHVSKHENDESHGNDELSEMLLRFIDDPKEGNLVYMRWLEHMKGTKSCRDWSVVYQRQLCEMNDNMNRVCLASYLGFPKTLEKWLDSSGLGPHTRYHAINLNWSPWSKFDKRFPRWLSEKPLWWSLAALASAHDEVKVLEHLSNLELHQQGNEYAEDEMPPIVAAAIGDSVEAARTLIEQRTDKHSALATRHGHILGVSIHCDSLEVLKLLLDQVLDKPYMVNEMLPSFQTTDFQSTPAITMLLAKGVDVNTPLADGTLLAVAAYRGWDDLVHQLLIDKHADVNTEFKGPELHQDELEGWKTFENALEASFCNYYKSTSIARLLIENGAHVGVKAFDIVWSQCQYLQVETGDPNGNPAEDLYGLLRLLVSNMSESDLHDTWERGAGLTTTVLIQLIQLGDVDGVLALINRGVDVNQLVGGRVVDAVNKVFDETMSRGWCERYPTGRMIKILRAAGANFQNLEGRQLNIALAAASWSGLDDVASILLDRNADPNAACEHRHFTALGAAAASEQPRAPETCVALLLRPDVDVNFCFWSLDQSDIPAKVALDYPLWFMIDKPSCGRTRHGVSEMKPKPNERLHTWARSASILLAHGAIWDVDFSQWMTCLQKLEPEFSSRNASNLYVMHQYWKRNRNQLSDSDAASEEWRIKDPVADSDNRDILRSMCVILEHFEVAPWIDTYLDK